MSGSHSASLRVRCPSPDDVPTAEALRHMVAEHGSVVLHLSTDDPARLGAGSRSLVDQIADGLPGNFGVFITSGDPGTTNIVVRRVVDRETLVRHEEELVGAVRQFRDTARQLVEHLAAHLQVEASCLWTGFSRTVPPGAEVPRGRARLDEDWTYWFHGREIGFLNTSTGQAVEVKRDYDKEFGVLDPWFFARFVRTTSGLESVAALFSDDFHDPRRAFEILESRRRLRRVAQGAAPILTGLVLAD